MLHIVFLPTQWFNGGKAEAGEEDITNHEATAEELSHQGEPSGVEEQVEDGLTIIEEMDVPMMTGIFAKSRGRGPKDKSSESGQLFDSSINS